MVIDPAIESHYGTGYERTRLFPGGRPSLEFVRSMELLERLLPPPPARVLDVGGGPGTYAAPLAQRGYRVHVVDPVPLHIEQARQAAAATPARGFTAGLGDARELAEPDASQDAVLLFGPLYHLTDAAHRAQALTEARRVLAAGGRLLGMAVCRFASLLDGLYRTGSTIQASDRSRSRSAWPQWRAYSSIMWTSTERSDVPVPSIKPPPTPSGQAATSPGSSRGRQASRTHGGSNISSHSRTSSGPLTNSQMSSSVPFTSTIS
jgi:SAM-dependent methyltransferase